jgi:hypothetical protein
VSGPPAKLVPQSDNSLKGEETVRFLIGSCIALALTGVLCAQTRDDLLSAKVDEVVTHLRQKQKIPGTSLAVVRGSKLPKITEALVGRGYSEDVIRKILGENFLRVMEQNERVCREMQVTEHDSDHS